MELTERGGGVGLAGAADERAQRAMAAPGIARGPAGDDGAGCGPGDGGVTEAVVSRVTETGSTAREGREAGLAVSEASVSGRTGTQRTPSARWASRC